MDLESGAQPLPPGPSADAARQQQSTPANRPQQRIPTSNNAPRPANGTAKKPAERPGMKEYIRIRSDSVGSTRGAFTGNTNTAKATGNAPSPPRRKKGPEPPVPTNLAVQAPVAVVPNAHDGAAATHDKNGSVLKVPPELSSDVVPHQGGVPPRPTVEGPVSPARGGKPQDNLPRPVPKRPGLKAARQDSMRGTFQQAATKEPLNTILGVKGKVWTGEPTSTALNPVPDATRHDAFVTQNADSLQFSDANLRGDAFLFSPEPSIHDVAGPSRAGSSAMSGYGSTQLAGSQILGNESAYFHESYNYGAQTQPPQPPYYHPTAGGMKMNEDVPPPGYYGQQPYYGGYHDPALAGFQQPQPVQPPQPFYEYPYHPQVAPQATAKAPVSYGGLTHLWTSISTFYYNALDDYYYAPQEEIGTFTGMVRNVVYDPTNPEFTSLQQFTWSVLIGIFFGILTAFWGQCIEHLVEFIWKDIPEQLLEIGIFTDLEGSRPLPHYVWICPAVFGGFLAWLTEYLPVTIPGQNEWIEALHRQGVLDPSTFWHILVISTMGMMSGLSLGPELPLVLLSGMAGSKLSTMTHQSVLSARVMVLTAGSAAIGGFFGFPMAGALFVLEIPHRMGLQYFEALSPATMSSIISVLLNRIVTGNDVKGYFDYPFLAASLKSHVFYIAVFYGVVGAFFGMGYCKGCIKLKMWAHDWFHEHHDDHAPHAHGKEAGDAHADHGHDEHDHAENTERLPLVGRYPVSVAHAAETKVVPKENPVANFFHRATSLTISHEPTRAMVVGVIAGIMVGVVSMFLPHNLFWGEAQLQTLIDKGRTPLPVFGRDGEPTEMLTAWGYCMVDPEDHAAILAGPGLKCSFLLTVSKIFVIGISLGTGIVGGHFWGPLYVGAAASNLFLDIMNVVHTETGFGEILYEYPCVALLCIMGATHVVTFRAHTAIMLILTLTISAFKEESGTTFASGDYSAVFPLLVVSCFVSLMISRDTIFYKQQRCRGDILASPEVLCEPGKEGEPMMLVMRDGDEDEFYNDVYTDDGSDELEPVSVDQASIGSISEDSQTKTVLPHPLKTVQTELTSEDIERQFAIMQQSNNLGGENSGPDQQRAPMFPPINASASSTSDNMARSHRNQDSASDGSLSAIAPTMSYNDESPRTVESNKRVGATESPNTSNDSGAPPRAPSNAKIDELLSQPIENRGRPKKSKKKPNNHRRIMSGSDALSYASMNSEGGRRHRASSVDRNGPNHKGDDASVASGSNSISHSRNSSIVSNAGMRERSGSRDGSRAGTPTSGLVAVKTQGSIQDFQPDLLTQARMRSSSVSRMVPKPERMHSRRKSQDFLNGAPTGVSTRAITDDMTGALSADAIERSFSSMQNQSNLENDSMRANNHHNNGAGNGRYSPYGRGRVGTDPVS